MKTLFERLSLENQNAILLKQVELPATWTNIWCISWKIYLEQDNFRTRNVIYYELCKYEFDLDKFVKLFEEDES